MKKLLLLLFFPLLLQGCTKDEESKTTYGLVLEGYVTFSVSDAQGNDHLNPASPGAVDLSKIKVYYVIDGKERLFYRSNLEAARGYLVYTPKDTGERYYSLRLFFNIESKEEVTTTIVDWGDGHRDVFKVAFIRKENRISQRSIWLNDSLIWDPANKIGGTQPMYEIKR